MLARISSQRRLWRVLAGTMAVAAVALAVGAGCGDDDDGPLASRTDPYDLVIVAGNNQRGEPEEALAQPLVVQAVDRRGRPVAGLSVQFAVTAGGGGVFASSETPAASVARVTGADGKAEVRLRLGPATGTNLVVATVSGMRGLAPTFTAVATTGPGDGGTTGEVPVTAGRYPDAAHFSLSVAQLNLPGAVTFGLQTQITAYVFDAASNPVATGTLVRFRTSGGGIETSARTDAFGRATATLTTAEPIPADGWAVITAEADGPERTVVTAQTRVLFSGATVIRLLQPATFAIEPGETQLVRFFVGDANGHPLAAGTSVTVAASGGSIVGQSTWLLPDTQAPSATQFAATFQAAVAGDETPQLTIAVTSPNGNRELALASGREGVTPEVSEQVPAAVTLAVADSVLVADGTSTTVVRVAVLDSAGNGIPNQSVILNATAGTIDAIALTDASGRAAATYRSAMRPEGVAAVALTARCGTLSATASLRLLGVRLRLTATPATLAADGLAQATVTAVLETEQAQPIPGVPVDFAASLGVLSATRATTDVMGSASVTYRSVPSSEDLAQVQVRALAAGLDAATTLRLLGVRLELTAVPDTIPADGNAQAALLLRLERSDGVPLANARISLEATLGALSAGVVETDAAGRAQAILVSQPQEGKALIKASYGDGLQARAEVAMVKGPPASIVLVSVQPPSIGVRGAGANETAVVVFEVRDAWGNRAADGETVYFSVTPGSVPALVGPDSTATVDGRVVASVASDTVAGTVQLVAHAKSRAAGAGLVHSEPVRIAIHGGHPDQDHFSLAPSPVNLAGRVVFGLESRVTAYVFDRYANPVPAGTAVYFTTNGGGIQGSALTDAAGKATVTLFTAAPIPPAADAYQATITGTTLDRAGQQIGTVTTVLFSGPTAPIQVDAGSETLDIPDGGRVIVGFTVQDIDGNPLMAGSTIKVSSDVAKVGGDVDVTVPDVRSGHTRYSIMVSDPAPAEDPVEPPKVGTVLIKVESPNGNRQLAIGATVD